MWPNPFSFGLYVLGTFFDKDDRKLWEKELYLYHKDSRNIYIDDLEEVDNGPAPPRFALTGKLTPILVNTTDRLLDRS